VVQLTDQLPGALKRMQATMAVIADMHPPPTDRTVAVKDVKFAESEIRVRGPSVGHGANLRDVVGVVRSGRSA
jgi:hypothetical protein